jgi:hypothetical protein
MQAQPERRERAEAVISVKDSETEAYDHVGDMDLTEVRIRETFSGDIEGESVVRALQVQHAGGSACLVSQQRVCGRLGERRGTFVLQGSETVADGRISATWSVVPGSGTGELAGLRGEGGFEGRFGEGSRGVLEYWFE